MNTESQKGFSLIELLLVVTIIGVIASISINWYFKAIIAAENQSAVGMMSLIRQNEIVFYAQNQRFGRLDEVAPYNNSFGTVGTDLVMRRGSYKFELTTSTGTPTASDPKNLQTEYLVTATRERGTAIPYVYTLNQAGVISRVLPDPGALGE